MKRIARVLPAFVVLALGGCASTMSGVGGTDNYACKAPEGTVCTSVSGVYANALHMRVPATPTETMAPPSAAPGFGSAVITPRNTSGGSIRSQPRVLRLWIAPWEDADGDLHEAARVHVVVDTGRWLIEHVRPISRSPEDAVSPPASAEAAPEPASPPSGSPPQPTPFPLPPTGMPSGSESGTTER